MLRHERVLCLNQCVLVSIFVQKHHPISCDMCVGNCVQSVGAQSVKACGDVIFGSIKRITKMQTFLCHRNVCTGVKKCSYPEGTFISRGSEGV